MFLTFTAAVGLNSGWRTVSGLHRADVEETRLSQQLRRVLLVEDTEERREPVFVATLKVTNEENRNQKKDLILIH